MAPSAASTFSCPRCGKRFVWKPALAGKRVSCKCGEVFEPHPVLVKPQHPSDTYDLSEEPPHAATAVVPVAPVASQPAESTAPVLEYRSAPPPRPEAQGPGFDTPEMYLATALLVAAVAFRITLLIFSRTEEHFATALLLVVAAIALNMIVMLVGCAISAKVLGVNFGALSQAIFKLCAISVVAYAAFFGATALDNGGITGMAVGWHLVVIIYWFLFSKLFKLEMQETLITVGIVSFMQSAAACAMFKAGAP